MGHIILWGVGKHANEYILTSSGMISPDDMNLDSLLRYHKICSISFDNYPISQKVYGPENK